MSSDRERAEADAIRRAQEHNAKRASATDVWSAVDEIHAANAALRNAQLDNIIKRKSS